MSMHRVYCLISFFSHVALCMGVFIRENAYLRARVISVFKNAHILADHVGLC